MASTTAPPSLFLMRDSDARRRSMARRAAAWHAFGEPFLVGAKEDERQIVGL
jgi:hypothetical protein